MDAMIIKSKMMKGIAERFIGRFIKKKTGYKVTPTLYEFQTINDGEESTVHINIDLRMSTEDLEKFLEGMGL